MVDRRLCAVQMADEVVPGAAYGVSTAKIMWTVGHIEHVEVFVRLDQGIHELQGGPGQHVLVDLP